MRANRDACEPETRIHGAGDCGWWLRRVVPAGDLCADELLDELSDLLFSQTRHSGDGHSNGLCVDTRQSPADGPHSAGSRAVVTAPAVRYRFVVRVLDSRGDGLREAERGDSPPPDAGAVASCVCRFLDP